jgi:hypothetical protein
MNEGLRHRRVRAWVRLQETPFQLPISVLAVLASTLTLVGQWSTLSGHMIVVLVTLGVGGALSAAGRLVADVDLESAGLALLSAALGFVFVENLTPTLTWSAVANLAFNYGALILACVVRLVVVRKSKAAHVRVANRRGRRSG